MEQMGSQVEWTHHTQKARVFSGPRHMVVGGSHSNSLVGCCTTTTNIKDARPDVTGATIVSVKFQQISDPVIKLNAIVIPLCFNCVHRVTQE